VGTTGIVRTDAGLVPRALVAVTVNERPMPAVSPGTVTCRVPAPTGTVPTAASTPARSGSLVDGLDVVLL
jgi:hypothetical protein